MKELNKYRLAVAIPTYNRASILNDLLWNIGPQIERHFPQCACYVIDNHSPDETGEVAGQHASRWKGIHYIKNERNIGGVRNIAKAIALPNADWVWLMGDDDIPMPWGVRDLLEELVTVESVCSNSVFHLMSEVKLTADKEVPAHYNNAKLDSNKNKITTYSNGVEIAEHGVHGLAWLSKLAIHRSNWNQELFEQIVRETDLYTHVRVLLDSACRGQTTYTKRCYVYATDRGSREYYFSKTAIARVCEFPEIEGVVVDAIGHRRARLVLRPGRRNWIFERGTFATKIGVFQEQYAAQLEYLRNPISPFWEERMLVKAIYYLTRIGWVRTFLKKLYFQSRGTAAWAKLDVNA